MSDLHKQSSPAILDALSDKLAQKLIQAANVIKYPDGHFVQHRGDMKTGISIIRTGAVRAGVFRADGSFMMSSILGPGHSFGEFTLFTCLPLTHDIVTAGATEIYHISELRFNRLVEEEPSLLRAFLTCTLLRSNILRERLDASLRLPIAQRTAHLLLSLTTPGSSDQLLRYRQADLAFTLGVSRVTLNRALKQLADRSLVKLGYGEITVPNRNALADIVSGHSD